LTQFAHAPNADDFPVMLAFLAKATMDARGQPKTVSGDPIASFDRWKKQGAAAAPDVRAVIETALAKNGFTEAAKSFGRTMRRNIA
jgi:hypothetical protein